VSYEDKVVDDRQMHEHQKSAPQQGSQLNMIQCPQREVTAQEYVHAYWHGREDSNDRTHEHA
jgi:hypothetical protein